MVYGNVVIEFRQDPPSLTLQDDRNFQTHGGGYTGPDVEQVAADERKLKTVRD